MLADLEEAIRRIARFLVMDPPTDTWPTIVRHCTFAEMKTHGDEVAPGLDILLKGGSNTFFYKGTNGRWRDVLSADELKLSTIAADREMTPECRRWHENGGPT